MTGPSLPTPEQISLLRELSAAAGQRYVAPNTRKQAVSRITDMRVRLGIRERQQPRRRPVPRAARVEPAADSWERFPGLLRQLGLALRDLERDAPNAAKRVHKLEASIDRLVGAPTRP